MTLLNKLAITTAFLLGLAAPCAHGQSRHFTQAVQKRAKQFGYSGSDHTSYYVSLVDLPFFQAKTNVLAFALSIWDDEAPEFRVWILSDKGLDQLADEQKLPHLTPREKHRLQQTAIVHEFVHGWGIDSERTTVAMTALIEHHDFSRTATPARWKRILRDRAAKEQALKTEQQKEQEGQDGSQSR